MFESSWYSITLLPYWSPNQISSFILLGDQVQHFKVSAEFFLSFVKPWVLLEYVSGVSWPQPLRISRSIAMAEFSVKSFTLCMWRRVFEACSQIFYLTGILLGDNFRINSQKVWSCYKFLFSPFLPQVLKIQSELRRFEKFARHLV